MPIFMDRHNMRGLTAEDVAEAHRRDLEVQDKYGVKYMTYWYDEARGTGFCLVEAPDAATAAHVHREAHGKIPSEIIPVELAVVEAFLGRIADPRLTAGDAVAKMGAGLRGVLVTDIVGSTEMTARQVLPKVVVNAALPSPAYQPEPKSPRRYLLSPGGKTVHQAASLIAARPSSAAFASLVIRRTISPAG